MKDLCDKYRKDNILLRVELRAAKGSRETTKRKMRIQLEWDGEEANLSENVAIIAEHICFHASNS
jgi:hypothetical protein